VDGDAVALAPVLEEAEGTRVSLALPAEDAVVASEREYRPTTRDPRRRQRDERVGEALTPALVWTDDAEAGAVRMGATRSDRERSDRGLFVFASANGHAQSNRTLTHPERGSTVHADFHLGPAFQVRGRVCEAAACRSRRSGHDVLLSRNVVQV
jgi:hypothetical protein